MRFTGQVRVPEVDHPGVPAIFLVEDGQAEVLLDGESLGRWSLYDVHASRLVSSAFSVSLDGEEITFIADEPVDFAYKGVDHMAEAWARYKAMTIPRRMVAVGRSRRGIRPSRIPELRQAMLANLAAYEAEDAATEGLDDGVVEERRVRFTPHPEKAPEVSEPLAGPVDSPAAPHFPAEAAVPILEAPPSRQEALRPGPGLVARSRPAAAEPPPLDPVEVFQPEPEPVAELEPEPEPEWEPVAELEPEPEPEALPEPVAELEPEPEPEALPEALPEPVAEPEWEPVAAQVPLTAPDADHGDPEPPLRRVVDLGAYEEVDTVSAATTTLEPPEPALAAAVVADKSGLLGAVRAAFVRNKGSHVHEFVEAPGGIGIIRHICNECGYISIGVSDTDID